jgi:protein-S-isoprenylcysteine O-methyltransferase Ste14
LASPSNLIFWIAGLAGLLGLGLAGWTVSLFSRFGNGTAAPWDPPRKFFARGPYLYVRNPLITGASLILAAESLLFQSWPLYIWLIVFVSGNFIYIPVIEEKR